MPETVVFEQSCLNLIGTAALRRIENFVVRETEKNISPFLFVGEKE